MEFLKVELGNQTDYANIYVVTAEGKTVGTIEVKLAGREAGKSFVSSFSAKYGKREIRKAYNLYRKEGK